VELLKNLGYAARDISPQTFLDPRAGVRYVANVASRLIKLQGGLFLWAALTRDEEPTDEPQMASVRSIA